MAGRFAGHLGLDYIDGFQWRIQAPLIWDVDRLGSGKQVIVPAGFVTDFNSIPRGLWNLFPPTQYGKASIIHDYLYRGGFITSFCGNYEVHSNPSRAKVDGIFREALGVEGCPAWKATAMWLGVRAGGWNAWSPNGR